ncbi:MAG TPA: hypothetical protein VFW64_12430 [Pseudonocardiaceae bacterium]|nr:hypothetical protein [Pseudonocardiaceae bacterium]
MSARQEYIDGLRALADLLEANPDLRLPYTGRDRGGALLVMPHGDERDEVAEWARALPGEKSKTVRDEYFDLDGQLHGLHLRVIAHRDKVCRKVVKGTREVKEQVPVKFTTVTKTVEDVEWVCDPLLGATNDDQVVSP